MTKYRIKLYSKDKKTINNFLQFFKQHQNKKNFPITLNLKRKKKRKNMITILKSPHVNKKAQTQFQQITYATVGEFFSWDRKKSAICLKKLKNNLFPGSKIKIENAFGFKSNSEKTFNGKILLIKKSTFSTLLSKKKQILIFTNQKIETAKNKKWKNNILKNFKKLDSYGFINRENKNKLTTFNPSKNSLDSSVG
nr:ribosomal protein S10 [Navicula sp.]